jgi:elongation factor Ts
MSMEISANLIKDLREKTGAGMMDCKKALVETQGDFDAAIDWLRKKGHAASAKRASRVAADGLVAVDVHGHKGIAIELNSETDFVARNDKFQGLVLNVLHTARACKSLDELSSRVQNEITEVSSVIGENLVLRRFATISVNHGVVAQYIHNAATSHAGKIGVLVALESQADKAALEAFGKKLAMHIAAANPLALTAEELNQDVVEKERAILLERFRESGKPEQIIERMVESAMKKYYQEAVLLEQAFVIDGKTLIKDLVAGFAKEVGSAVTIAGFIRFALGEGIQKD